MTARPIQPSRLGALARRSIGNFLVALAVLALILTSLIPQADLGFPLAPLAMAGALIATTGIGLLGRRLAMTGRKQRAAISAIARTDDPRPPVLYLRSFADDELVADANIVHGFIQLTTEEEQFAKVFNRIGPFTAIGDPRESLPDLGATRLYVRDPEWMNEVEDLLARSPLVVLRASETEGLLWELRTAISRLEPRRLLLLVPLGRERYDALRRVCDRWLPKPLPDLPKIRTQIGSVQGIVRFMDDWSPEFLPARFSAMRMSMRTPIAPHLLLMLRPVFDRLEVPWSKPRVGTLPVFFLTVIGFFIVWVALAMWLDS